MAAHLRPADTRDRLTLKEIAVAERVAAGLGNKDVADELGIKAATVTGHMASIGFKLCAGSRPSRIHAALSTGQVNAPAAGTAPSFSQDELRLLQALATQPDDDAIAAAAGLVAKRVSLHVRALLLKAGARNATHLVGLSHAWELLGPSASAQSAANTATTW
ncbi:LuxR C-terminal-related transcriptional regulator [Streptomyces sp. NPDC088768]|uniref:LuxR C-terminal-related transcriptional regulator n=1 Tax=Streptomyces sp. NPDC088768 TaxID=3365894 RepID=UPI003805EA39